MSSTQQFDPKDPAEIVPLTFDFSALAASVSTPVIQVTRIAGDADPNPAAMLIGSAQISGAKVVQKAGGGLDGRYKIRCDVNGDGGAHWALTGTLPVETQ